MPEVMPKIQFYVELVPAFHAGYSLFECQNHESKEKNSEIDIISKPTNYSIRNRIVRYLLTESQMRNNYHKEMNSPVQKWIHA